MRKPSGEKFSLKWTNFQPNLVAGFHDLFLEETMVDVTLAVEGKLLQAHKIVLSVCSKYFKDIFKANPCKHPVVILKDVSYQEMVYMVDFMYKGEAVIPEKDMPAFFNLAEILKVRGLADSEDGDKESEPPKDKNKERDDSETETETENQDWNKKVIDDLEPLSPPLPSLQKRKLTRSQVRKNTESTVNVNESNCRSKGPRRKKRKLSSVEDSQMDIPTTSQSTSSQPHTLAIVKEEIPDIDDKRLMLENHAIIDVNFNSTVTEKKEMIPDLKVENNLDDFGNSSREPDFNIGEFANLDEHDEVLNTLYSTTELKGKIILYKGFRYRFHCLYMDGTKLWWCTMRGRKCHAELEVHPALGVILINEHSHPQPKV